MSLETELKMSDSPTVKYIRRIGDRVLWDSVAKQMAGQKASCAWRCEHDVSVFESCEKCDGSRDWSLVLPAPCR